MSEKRYRILELDLNQLYRIQADPHGFVDNLRDAVTGSQDSQEKLREEYGVNYLCPREDGDFVIVGKGFQPPEKRSEARSHGG